MSAPATRVATLRLGPAAGDPGGGPLGRGRRTTAADARLELVLTEETHELLDLPGLAVPPRPAGTMPVPSRLSDAVLVTGRWLLAAPE